MQSSFANCFIALGSGYKKLAMVKCSSLFGLVFGDEKNCDVIVTSSASHFINVAQQLFGFLWSILMLIL
jgi:hypothetical protein